jgi:zinc/manganese transport system substrate-binding protein
MPRRLMLAGVALSPVSAYAAAPLSVVASFSITADIARQAGGDLVRVTSLVPPDADAHVYQPTAADSRALGAASVLIENGLGFEGWLARLGTAVGFKGVRVVASDGVVPRTMLEGSTTFIDPHAWQDPRNGMIYARNIAAGFASVDPANAAIWRANAARYAAELQRTDEWIAEQFAPIPPELRRIITTHDAFGYYGARYGIEFLAAEGLSTDAEPSASAIAALVAQIRREKAKSVFLENMTDPRLAKMLARETGAVLSGPLCSDALSRPGGPAPDYVTMLRYNTTLFARALR